MRPRKRQAESQLRPIGDAFHERIDGHDGKRQDAEAYGEEVELDQHQEADQGLTDQEGPSLAAGDLSGRQRPRTGPGHLLVDFLVDQIVVGATRAAHGDRANQKQKQMPGMRPRREGEAWRIRARDTCHGGGPPARPQQQPPTDRPVPTGQLRIGPLPARQRAIDPMARRRIGDPALTIA